VATDESREIGAVCDFTVVPGVIHGLRAWEVHEFGSRLLLGSIARAVIWTPDEPMVARCAAGWYPGGDPETHPAPGYGCSCGINAYHPFADNAEFVVEEARAPDPGCDGASDWTVYGVISAWGRVEVHEAGFRAEHGRVAAILSSGDWEGTPYAAAIEGVAREYGVPVIDVETPDQLLRICRRRYPGLSEELVDDLLVDEHEITLKRAELSLEFGGARIFNGAGYLIEGERYRPEVFDPEWALSHRFARVIRVAGARYTGDAIQRSAFDLSHPVRLVAEPENPHDPDAVAIYDADGETRVGYVPRSLAYAVKRDLERDRLGQPTVIWEWRKPSSGRREGICVLIPGRRLPILADDEPFDEMQRLGCV
jgi:hypothetical protein